VPAAPTSTIPPVTEAAAAAIEPALEIDALSKSYRVGHLRPRRRPALHDLHLTDRKSVV